MIQIAPSILAANFAKLGEEVKEVEQAGAQLIHIDVMDGHFVPNISFGSIVLDAIRPLTKLPLDVHLMIENPDQYIELFAKAGADYITVHVEACRHLHRTIQLIRSFGVKAGVVLNPHTPIDSIQHILEDIDMVLLMTVNPGFGGQKFIHSVIPKIEALSTLIKERGLDIAIEIDGGITAETIVPCAQAGATIFVAGSAIYSKEDRTAALQEILLAGEAAIKG
ncbi:ribulose-phosphate 3-epimerase [Lysinibacillus sp. OL1_EC]|uniref:ribulose-phosphate 3-epimerase n=1 Tax=unclassified Lysinibacillus TaxID=2636778 RepID=UPI00103868AD|nr:MULTISPECIES: ribulose-phosphate 3-epimerase [unclassified Lysinibacillus]MCM0625763.1 ribulose-phosphate 3-epimerase [Lysinibacillus sp. OL1_EC]MCS5502242.1 ribulose-phosphate 3-epimerase [Lysinibacillus sp. A4]TBV86403.1 ribulose-phosphate 3-epimerase [Lysinibacillus sp. OL1]UKJ47608.1 ribulose-phosphate 3-epimerase [Lysinibacillus sp. ACHW1.5]WGT41692.1 ribulose-phosphate 3-epimerase [Lysinibacillus sp. 1 U-2021]